MCKWLKQSVTILRPDGTLVEITVAEMWISFLHLKAKQLDVQWLETEPWVCPTRQKRKTTQEDFLLQRKGWCLSFLSTNVSTRKLCQSTLTLETRSNNCRRSSKKKKCLLHLKPNSHFVIRIYLLIVTLNKSLLKSTSNEDCPRKQASKMNLQKLQIFPVCKQLPETHQPLYCFIHVICSVSCRWFCFLLVPISVPAERTDLPEAAPLSGSGTPLRRCSFACMRCWNRQTGIPSSAL